MTEKKVTETVDPENDHIGELYKESTNDLPPADLDKLILKASRASTQEQGHKHVGDFPGNWKATLSMAAVMVLAVTVIIRIGVMPQDDVLNESELYQLEADAGLLNKTKNSSGERVLQEQISRDDSEEQVIRTLVDDKMKTDAGAVMSVPESLANKPQPTIVRRQLESPGKIRSKKENKQIFDAKESRDIQIMQDRMGHVVPKVKKKAAQAVAPAAYLARERVGNLEQDEIKFREDAEDMNGINEENLQGAQALIPKTEEETETPVISPENWVLMIQEMIDQGDLEQAHRQITLLRQTYPDFEILELEKQLSKALDVK